MCERHNLILAFHMLTLHVKETSSQKMRLHLRSAFPNDCICCVRILFTVGLIVHYAPSLSFGFEHLYTSFLPKVAHQNA